jgi:hypothetical protein
LQKGFQLLIPVTILTGQRQMMVIANYKLREFSELRRWHLRLYCS